MGRRPKSPPLVKLEPTNVAPLLAAIDATVEALSKLRAELLKVELGAAPKDAWVGQRESQLRPRVHARLCRAMLARGDERAAVRMRVHYLRQSAIDECLSGAPRAAEQHAGRPLTAVERLQAELRATGRWP